MPTKKKVLTVLGARPQFIKSKPLSALIRNGKKAREILVHTGQHYDLSMYTAFLRELSLPKPDYFLGINREGNARQVARMAKRLSGIIKNERPDLLLVYGDTNSTLAGALAAKDAGVRLAHVEAGLRSYDLAMAEELNRVVTDRISDLLFAPVKEAVANLKKEGIRQGVYLTGDPLYDLLKKNQKSIDKFYLRISAALGLKKMQYLFFTLHRAETVDDPRALKSVLEGVAALKQTVIFPVHPRTQKMIARFGLQSLIKKIKCLPPQSYLATLAILKNAQGVITDSGGIQREAYLLKTPCLTLRDRTEWNQTLSGGWNRLLPPDGQLNKRLPDIIEGVRRPSRHPQIFGDGKAAEKILEIILKC